MYFTFKGITSEQMGLVVNKMPTYVKPKRRSEVIEVQGKDGANIIEYGFAPYTIQATVILMDLSKLDEIISWLDGSGQLVVSDDPYKYRNVSVLEGIDYSRLSDFKEASVEFYVYDPFRYVLNDINRTFNTFPATIKNNGTYLSQPVITIAGSGSISVTINGTTFEYTFQTGEGVTIDCQNQDATYQGSLRNQYMSGDFPVLDVGVNNISVTGNVTSITFEKYTRYL